MSSPDSLIPGPGRDVLGSSQVSCISTDLEKNNIGDTDEEKGTIGSEQKETTPPNADEDEDEDEYPQGAKLAVIVLALCLSVFLMALDFTIVATAIPKITDQFHGLGDVA